MPGQAARMALAAAFVVGALGSAPAHAAVKAKAAATIPCASSAPVGDANVDRVVVGRDVRGWQLDEHYRDGRLAITRCDASGRFARSQEFMPVPVAGGGTVLALTDEAQPWRGPDGSWGRLERSSALPDAAVPQATAAAVRRSPRRLHTVRRDARRLVRDWGRPQAKASDVFDGYPDGCAYPNDYSTGAYWHRKPDWQIDPEYVLLSIVGSTGNAADVELANGGGWAAWVINHFYTDCSTTVDASTGSPFYWYPAPSAWSAIDVQAPSAWLASAPTTVDNVPTFRWGRADLMCGTTTSITCTLKWTNRSGYLADADTYILPDNSTLPGYPGLTFTWGGLHNSTACTVAQTFCSDFLGAMLSVFMRELGVNSASGTTAQTMNPRLTRGYNQRTLGKGDITALRRVVYYPTD